MIAREPLSHCRPRCSAPRANSATASPSSRSALLTLGLLLTVASCKKPPAPWARMMTKSERVAWVAKCGSVPAADVESNDGEPGYSYTSYSVKTARRDLDVLVCMLSWSRTKSRLLSLEISLADSRVAAAARSGGAERIQSDRVEPYLSLVLSEVPADLRPAIRQIADRDSQVVGVTVGRFYVDGGYGPTPGSWHLAVREQ